MGKRKNFWIEAFEYGLEIGMGIDEAESYATESESLTFEELPELSDFNEDEQDEETA